jgi:hypothetical protein
MEARLAGQFDGFVWVERTKAVRVFESESGQPEEPGVLGDIPFVDATSSL